MSDQQQQAAQAGAGDAQAGGADQEQQAATMDTLTERLEAANAEIARLKGIETKLETNLIRQARRSERMESIVRSQLDGYREQIPETMRKEIEGLPIDQQWRIASELARGTAPTEGQSGDGDSASAEAASAAQLPPVRHEQRPVATPGMEQVQTAAVTAAASGTGAAITPAHAQTTPPPAAQIKSAFDAEIERLSKAGQLTPQARLDAVNRFLLRTPQ